MAHRVPKSVSLPSGLKLDLDLDPDLDARSDAAPRAREPGAPLFAELSALVGSGDLRLRSKGLDVDVATLSLADFHTLRAIATQAGLLAEEPFAFTCRNCDAAMDVAPCAALPLGPFVDGELDDPELDATLAIEAPHAIPDVRLLSGATAREVRLAPRTAGQALPLHRALRRRRFTVTADAIRGMGVASLGDEADAARIARALARASDEAWDALTQLFLDAHYPPRLFAVVLCAACGARNDVDAPADREFDRAPTSKSEQTSGARALHRAASSNEETFPDFDAFTRKAEALKDEILGTDDSEIAFVVDGGVAACDDGGEPLLGSYVPAFEGSAAAPSRAAEITVYYRTFRSIWCDDGPYDWEAELRETIEHELEHHENRDGHDPVDDEERAEIAREAERVLGKKAVVRGAVAFLGADVATFWRRTWPVWLLVALATIAATLVER